MSSSRKNQKTKADNLKEQGNKLHKSGDYRTAIKKYTEAIRVDPKNAILWSNRAASCIALSHFQDAIADARKAIELDPNYDRAHSKLAEASAKLSLWPQSILAWKNALRCLPNERPLTPKEQAVKNIYEHGLGQAEEGFAKPCAEQSLKTLFSEEGLRAPWARAYMMQEEHNRNQTISSALVILGAFQDFTQGAKLLTFLDAGNNEYGYMGPSGEETSLRALELLSDGILRDSRIFAFPGFGFKEKLDSQVACATRDYKAWTDSGLKAIQREFQSRLHMDGWDGVRCALSVTVRSWILKGCIQDKAKLEPTGYYRMVIEVLEWGRRVWANVSLNDRGVIFELSFIRAVKCLHLKVLMQAPMLGHALPGGEAGIDHIAGVACGLLEELNKNPFVLGKSTSTPIDYSRYASFWLYPRGDANAALGWYYLQTGRWQKKPESQARYFLESAAHYMRAANCLPLDDEYYASYLAAGIKALFHVGIPLGIILPLCERLWLAYPAIQNIWSQSPIADGIQGRVLTILSFESGCREKLRRGEYGMNFVAYPSDVEPVYKYIF